MPSVTITGRVLYQPGLLGSKRPLRNVGNITVWLWQTGMPQQIFVGSAVTNSRGWFIVNATLQSIPALDLFIQVDNLCGTESYLHQVRRPIRQSSSLIIPDDVGEFAVPWEPSDDVFAGVDSKPIKSTQQLAKVLAEKLKSPQYPVYIYLQSESLDGTGKDYTPAQRLLIPLKVQQPGFLKHLIEDIQDELFSTKSDTVNGIAVEILERFSTVNAEKLEEGKFLNRLLSLIQRAYPSNSYSENLMADPIHDMAAAIVIVFLAGLMKKEKVQPTITFRPTSLKCRNGVTQFFSRIVIHVSKN